MNNDTKLIVELIKGMGKRLDDMKREIEGVKSSYQYGSKVSKEFFDKACKMQDDRNEEQQKQIDNHCSRLRETEGSIIELQPSKRFYNKIRDFAVGSIIVLGGAVIAMASYIYDKLN